MREQPDIQVIATGRNQVDDVMVWNYHDEDVGVPDPVVDLNIAGLPGKQALVEHFRIDRDHSNAFTAWKKMGSPQAPSPEQYEQLERAGQLQLLSSPAWISVERGEAHLEFKLPRNSVSLVRLSW